MRFESVQESGRNYSGNNVEKWQLGPFRPVKKRKPDRTQNAGEGARNTVAGWLTTAADYVGVRKKEKSYDDEGFRRGRAMEYPPIPGEGVRNRELERITEEWSSRTCSRDPSVDLGDSPTSSVHELDGTYKTLTVDI